MAETGTDTHTDIDAATELADWVDDHWDPDLTLGEWWQLLADSGYAHPSLPENAGGKGWSHGDSVRAMRVLAERNVVGPPPGLGTMLAAARTIAAHGFGTRADRPLRPGDPERWKAWCQLFSEPVAGSDLAGLQTRAVRDGDEWIVSGQKVWTSQGHYADLGLLVARTDRSCRSTGHVVLRVRHMDQPGVDVRPLKEMTGRTFFSEVFMDGARVPDDAMIGARGDGWRVANTTLAVERATIGAGRRLPDRRSRAEGQPVRPPGWRHLSRRRRNVRSAGTPPASG